MTTQSEYTTTRGSRGSRKHHKYVATVMPPLLMELCIYSSQSADLRKEKAKILAPPARSSNALLPTKDHNTKTRPSTTIPQTTIVHTKRSRPRLSISNMYCDTSAAILTSLRAETYLLYVQGALQSLMVFDVP